MGVGIMIHNTQASVERMAAKSYCDQLLYFHWCVYSKIFWPSQPMTEEAHPPVKQALLATTEEDLVKKYGARARQTHLSISGNHTHPHILQTES